MNEFLIINKWIYDVKRGIPITCKCPQLPDTVLHKRYGKKGNINVQDNIDEDASKDEAFGKHENIRNAAGRGGGNKRSRGGDKLNDDVVEKSGRKIIDVSDLGSKDEEKRQRKGHKGSSRGAAAKQPNQAIKIAKARPKAKIRKESDSSDFEEIVLPSQVEEQTDYYQSNVKDDADKTKKRDINSIVLLDKTVPAVTPDSADSKRSEMEMLERLRQSELKISELTKLLMEKSAVDTATSTNSSKQSEISVMAFQSSTSNMQLPKIAGIQSNALSSFMFQSGCNFQRTVMLEEELEFQIRKSNRDAQQRAYLQSIQKLFE